MQLYTPHKDQNDKDARMYRLSNEVNSTSQLQAKGHFRLILRYELWSLLKTLL